MNNTKVAFLCPLYDIKNHFELGLNLYRSKLELDIKDDLYFIFSDESQYQKFSNLVLQNIGSEVLSIILDPSLLDLKSKVVVKKFYGLRKLMDKYDYLSLIDSETVFVKKGDFHELFREIWDTRNCLISNYSLDGFFILRKCFTTLGIYNNKKLRKAFKHYRLNFWFNEIPVYKCDTLPDFFRWLDKFDINGWGNEWNCFEYYIYAAYLILEKDYKLLQTNYTSMGGIMEYLPAYPERKQREIIDNLCTHWSSNPDVTNNNTYLLFHLDRDINSNCYSYNLSFKEKTVMYIRMYKAIILDMLKF